MEGFWLLAGFGRLPNRRFDCGFGSSATRFTPRWTRTLLRSTSRDRNRLGYRRRSRRNIRRPSLTPPVSSGPPLAAILPLGFARLRWNTLDRLGSLWKFGGALLQHLLALYDRVRHLRGEQTHRAKRIVVTRYDIVDAVRVAVRVHDRNRGDPKLVRLSNRNFFLVGIDDEDDVGQRLHISNAGQILFKRGVLAFQLEALLLCQRVEAPVGAHRLDILHALNGFLYRLEVGKEPAQPPLVDEVLSRALCFLFDRILRLPLRSYEQE